MIQDFSEETLILEPCEECGEIECECDEAECSMCEKKLHKCKCYPPGGDRDEISKVERCWT